MIFYYETLIIIKVKRRRLSWLTRILKKDKESDFFLMEVIINHLSEWISCIDGERELIA